MSSSAIDIFGNQVDNFKNKIINGNFDFWERQRGVNSAFSIGSTSSSLTAYTADRWFVSAVASGTAQYSATVERKTFATSQMKIKSLPHHYCEFSGPVSEGNGTETQMGLCQRIEDVRTMAGKQVTVSFWIKGSVEGYAAARVSQNFGSGGSPSTKVHVGQRQFAVATSWTQVIFTFNMPSIGEGAVFGTNVDHCVEFALQTYCSANFMGNQEKTNYQGTLSIAQVQIEEGAQATLFDKRMPAIEEAMCQRFFEQGYAYQTRSSLGSGDATQRYNYVLVPYNTRKKEFNWVQDAQLTWDELANSGDDWDQGFEPTDQPPDIIHHNVKVAFEGFYNIPDGTSKIQGGVLAERQPEGFVVNYNCTEVPSGNARLRGVWATDAEIYCGENPT